MVGKTEQFIQRDSALKSSALPGQPDCWFSAVAGSSRSGKTATALEIMSSGGLGAYAKKKFAAKAQLTV
jgi:hypothetical protein